MEFENINCCAVILCRWSAKQTIPLSVLARNQTKGYGREISGDRKWGRNAGQRVRQRDLEEGVGEGWRERPVDTEQRDQSDEMRSRAVRGIRVKMSRHSSSVVEFSLEIHASVSLYMLTGMQSATILLVLHFELTPSILFVCSFFSRSLDCISCSSNEMCDAPIGTTSWSPAVKWNGSKKLMYRGGRGGNVTVLWFGLF